MNPFHVQFLGRNLLTPGFLYSILQPPSQESSRKCDRHIRGGGAFPPGVPSSNTARLWHGDIPGRLHWEWQVQELWLGPVVIPFSDTAFPSPSGFIPGPTQLLLTQDQTALHGARIFPERPICVFSIRDENNSETQFSYQ